MKNPFLNLFTKNPISVVTWMVVSGFLILCSYHVARFSNKKTITTKVSDKERITKTYEDGRIESYYLIFTDSGTFKLEDELLYGNFNSSDLYGRIRRDSTYQFTVIGFRVGIISEYPNIIEVK